MLVQTRCPGYWSSSDSGHCVPPPCRHIHINIRTISSGGENQQTHLCTSMETTTHSQIIHTQAYTHSHTHTHTHTSMRAHTHTHTHTKCMHALPQTTERTDIYHMTCVNMVPDFFPKHTVFSQHCTPTSVFLTVKCIKH